MSKTLKTTILFLSCLTLSFASIYASDETKEPINATTEDGENVTLYPDGKWEYTPEIKRIINPKKFLVPPQSKEMVTGKEIKYTIYYDATKWKPMEKSLSEIAEYSLDYKNGKAYSMVVAENESVPLEDLRDVVLNNVREASGGAKVIAEEERNVNGLKMIMMTVKAKIEGMNFVYVYYIYSNDKTAFQVVTFTSEESFPEYKNDLENFLNGFVLK